ncbi:MAG: M15 family metallopeptidase [Thermodesulfobacteriota bacterium]
MKRRTALKNILLSLLGSSTLFPFLTGPAAAMAAEDAAHPDEHIRDYLFKMKHYDRPHASDTYLESKDHGVFQDVHGRFNRLQQTMGHGHFSLVDFDQAVKIAGGYASIGAFSRQELEFCEKIFYTDGALYGFLGAKPLLNLTDQIHTGSVTKIPLSGNYLYQGLSLETYLTIKKHVGPPLVLTSGIRGIAKQFLLFLNKINLCNGNISRASRSIAPPGYSYHGLGDFDVGQNDFGAANFTERFTRSTVFCRLQGLGYIDLRYPEHNLMGVRFEPWHIRVKENSAGG